MTITTEVNEAKGDLDVAMGEIRRATAMHEEILNHGGILVTDYDQLMEAVNTVESKVRRVRASL